MRTADFLKQLFEWLNNNSEYAVLRNFEGLPYSNNSRDIDIAIEKKELIRIRKHLVELIQQCGWYIITYLNSDRLVTWVCGAVHKDGSVDLVQLDFFYQTSIFGIVLLENKEILKCRKFNGQVYHADKGFEFLDKYLYDRAVGAEYPDKYKATRMAAENILYVNEMVARIFEKDSLAACDRANKKELLKSALKWNLRRFGLKTISHCVLFEYYRIKSYLWSPTGFSIGFTGPDGSGKTTVIELL